MHKINTRLVKMMKAVELVIAVLLMIAIAISTLATVCFGAESLMNQSFQLDAILEKALTLVVGICKDADSAYTGISDRGTAVCGCPSDHYIA